MTICYRRANRACSPHRGPCGTNRCVHRGGASGCQCVCRHLQLGVHLRPTQGRGRDRGEAPFHRVRRHRGQPPACMAGRSQVRAVRQRRERAAGAPAAGRSPDTVQGQKAFQGPAHGHALVDGHTHRVCLPHLPSNAEHGCPGQLALRHPLGAGRRRPAGDREIRPRCAAKRARSCRPVGSAHAPRAGGHARR
jgi:hypothetical protein